MEKIKELDALHQHLAILMNEVHKICESINVKYTLMGGSLIGAMRHQGFIPWDDDMDIGMPWQDYKRFRDYVLTLDHDWLEFDLAGVSKDYWGPYIKAYDKRTTFWETDRTREMVKGIFIDIFPIVYAGDSKKEAFREFKRHRLLQAFLRRRGYKYHTGFFRELIYTLGGKILDSNFWMERINEQYERLCMRPKLYVSDMDGNEKGIVPASLFAEFVLMPFESFSFMCIKEADDYLRKVFGNYMELPPEEERTSHHIIYMNMNLPYKEFLHNNKAV